MQTKVTKNGKRSVGNGIFSEKAKYKIAELLYNMPFNVAKETKKQLPKVLEISRQTLENWLQMTVSDKSNIPLNEFLRLCVFFNIEPFEMINYEIEEILIVDESNIEQKKLGKKIGLVK